MTHKHHALVVFGTRPEFIKVAPLIQALHTDERFTCTTCFTGQHPDMVKPLLGWFNITPDHTLHVMAHGQNLSQLSAKLLNELQPIIEEASPDTLFVQGDTATATMGALAGYYSSGSSTKTPQEKHMKIGHIEAGLRTYDNYSPFPEEANRRLIGSLATHHFAPTQANEEALHQENITKNTFTVGNTVIDALHTTTKILAQHARSPFAACGMPKDAPIVLVTGHRRESYGKGFQNICLALKALCEKHPATHFVYPVHLSGNVQTPVRSHLGDIANMHLIPPLDYPDFVAAMQQSYLILTDSGGVQEEAPSLGKPVLVMRDKTERQEAIKAGTVKLVGTNIETIVAETSKLLTDTSAYAAMANAVNPYGDGKACARILNIMAKQA